jgi:hypothetical protein
VRTTYDNYSVTITPFTSSLSSEWHRGRMASRVVMESAQKQPHPLSFRSQVHRRGICPLPAAKQQIPRATLPRFGMTILLGIFKLHHYGIADHVWSLEEIVPSSGVESVTTSRKASDAMRTQQINSISGKVVIAMSLTALLAVLSGYTRPPQPDEGAAAHIFQLSIAALVPMILLFLATADWRRPLRSARPLAFPAAALVLAFAALFYLEHYR